MHSPVPASLEACFQLLRAQALLVRRSATPTVSASPTSTCWSSWTAPLTGACVGASWPSGWRSPPPG